MFGNPWDLVGWMVIGWVSGLALVAVAEWLSETAAILGKHAWLMFIPFPLAALALWGKPWMWVMAATLTLAFICLRFWRKDAGSQEGE
jgi:hypothetical protein